ncbi:MAG: FAD-dependent oxidoreductase [Clostridia bacterium]|jgi:NADPH-dependent 2,4-dienoyl-CoA reductase/sulfur reductase-like enzyme|nr:FAD-dependent oxidoreductase [Clostridia bacterium]
MAAVSKQVVIIGAGPAGLAAAVAAYDGGATDIVILERDVCAGGILEQCIHNGFGLHTFGAELSGPEYAARFFEQTNARGIRCEFGATALSVGADRTVRAVSERGVTEYKAGAVVLACGCRERPRGAVNIAGTRPSGVFSAGTAQRLVNVDGEQIGRDVFILGSGDIGLIMARRMVFEGARVHGVAEIMPYSSGLSRNIAQCLDDFGIPLMLSTTVVEIRGRERLSSVVIANVDERLAPIPSTAREIKCDTLLLSVGLLPENELAKSCGVALDRATGGGTVNDRFMTDVDGVFMCGNCLHVHDLVDYVSAESAACGRAAARYVLGGGNKDGGKLGGADITTSGGIRYCVPQRVERNGGGRLTLRMRVDGVYRKCRIAVVADGKELYVKPRPIVTPGEMETLELDEAKSAALRAAERVEIKLIRSEAAR